MGAVTRCQQRLGGGGVFRQPILALLCKHVRLDVSPVIVDEVGVRGAVQVRGFPLGQVRVDFRQRAVQQGNAKAVDNQMVILHEPVIFRLADFNQVIAEQRLSIQLELFHKPLLHPGERLCFALPGKIMQRHVDRQRGGVGLQGDAVFVALFNQ